MNVEAFDIIVVSIDAADFSRSEEELFVGRDVLSDTDRSRHVDDLVTALGEKQVLSRVLSSVPIDVLKLKVHFRGSEINLWRISRCF